MPLEAARTRRGRPDRASRAARPSTNPVPWGPFVDCVFIGEAEGWIERRLLDPRRDEARGAPAGRTCSRSCAAIPRSGTRGRHRVRTRALAGLRRMSGARPPRSRSRACASCRTTARWRSCGAAPTPAGSATPRCSTGPAGRRVRMRSAAETHALVREAGYRQITLSSLSSGDYRGIHGLVRELNAVYAPRKVSFSLPSLHVDSLALQLLEEISEVRKSGLTFAVETAAARVAARGAEDSDPRQGRADPARGEEPGLEGRQVLLHGRAAGLLRGGRVLLHRRVPPRACARPRACR